MSTEEAKRAAEKLVDHVHAHRLHAMESLRSYGQNAIQGMFLLNGGAIIALLTLTGSLIGHADQSTLNVPGFVDKLIWALAIFAAGLLFAVATSGVAYLNYNHHAFSFWHPFAAFEWLRGKKLDDDPSQKEAVARTARVGVSLLTCSAVMFLLGVHQSGSALLTLVHPTAVHLR